MKLSKVFNVISSALEQQVALAIVDIMEKNGWNQIELDSDGGWDMSFYSHTMKRLNLKSDDTWVINALAKDDPNGAYIEHELFDNGVLPLADLLIILEELERKEEEHVQTSDVSLTSPEDQPKDDELNF